MLESDIKTLLKAMNFLPKNGTNNVYFKTYKIGTYLYEIFVDFNNKKIDYGNKIKLGNATTCNFAKPENFVVLECVNRLIEKGYKPENIELEKIYPSGHGHSGNLDILIYDDNKKAYLMIECKTWGTEYKKEINKMLKDGGQLFTYYALDRDAKYLCLYESILKNSKIDYKNSIISIDNEWFSLSTSKEIYTHWNKSFKDNGIFEKHASPYNIKHKTLTYEMLEDLKEEDSGKIFNQIMEILRHNVVSDKPNAFNKLLNLFVCKIIDEDRNSAEELHFQWLDDDTDESLQMRLNDLYKKGMWRFLNINVTDYSETEINNALQGIDADESFKQTIKDMFIDTRLKKSPNFAFKEVLDEKSFKANAKIVKEIVQLLQGYKFRYRQKHQFLGDFFELLLNTSMKQEAGQYFTPVPITRFIISSLPIKEMIVDKIKNNESEILPVVIDYAAGSGHFLTEYMEQVQNILEEFGMSLTKEEIDKIVDDLDISFATPTIKNKIRTWIESEKFIWAKDYVYGIDLDDRLVKTAKVSAFFNGDGEANIIWANGLDNFKKSNEYIGKLKETQTFDKKNNGQFDILISNPPYSVEAFKSTLKNGKETFELYDYLTDNSSEIECLFVERMKQLLKVGGKAGVILPISILTNSGIHSKAREIIFKYFKIKSIVELGSGTFMKTGTNTIILFLERRLDNDFKEVERAINKFFDDNLDVTVLGIENAFSKYVMNVYDDLSFKDYLKLINGEVLEHELYKDYNNEFVGNLNNIKQLEKEKMLYFILTCEQETVIIKTGKKQDEKNFLGYEFSERRGHEGLKWLPNGTKLYNENDQLDVTKANSYIYNAFNEEKAVIDKTLEKNISYVNLSSLFEYGTAKFDKKINLNKKYKINISSKYKLEKLENLVTTIESGSRPTGGVSNITEGILSLGGEHIGNNGELFLDKLKYVPISFYNNADKGKIQHNDILVCKDGALTGKVCTIPNSFEFEHAMVNEHVFILRANEDKILQKYLFTFLFSDIGQSVLKSKITGQAQGGLNSTNLKDIRIPLMPIDIQIQLVNEVENIENKIKVANEKISEYEEKIKSIASGIKNYSTKFSNIATLEYGKALKKSSRRKGNYYVTGANGIIGMHDEYIVESPCIIVGRKGSAGKVNYFDKNCYPIDTTYYVKPIHNTNMKFLYYQMLQMQLEKHIDGIGAPGLNRNKVYDLHIQIPPIEEQNKIVEDIEKYENYINDFNKQIEELNILRKTVLEKYL